MPHFRQLSLSHLPALLQSASQRSKAFFQHQAIGQALHKASQSSIAWAVALAVLSAAAIRFGLPQLAATGQIALMVFALAMIAWSVLRLDETPVAIAAGLALVLFKATTAQQLYAGMGDDLIWLLIASFILAAVLKQSGVAQRMVLALLGARDQTSTASCAALDLNLQEQVQAKSWPVRALFIRVTWMIIATAFIVPSTSGRAALLVPVYLLLAQSIESATVRRALALLFPSVILLSACASLLGAGAHLVAVDFMAQMELPTLSYAQWALLGTPFAVASSFAAVLMILHLFVPLSEQQTPLQLPIQSQEPMTRKQWAVVGITAATVLLWAFGATLGLEAALAALIGVLAATTKSFTGISLKAALKAVDWNLILFLAATMVMGEALLQSGAAQALAQSAQALLPAAWRMQSMGVLIFVSVIALFAHLVITSRTARALVLIPTLAIPMAVGGIHAQALIFIVVLASGFCQTFAVSAKPVAMFTSEAQAAFDEKDLLRLSLWLLPVMLGLILIFATVVWPLLGMPLSAPAVQSCSAAVL